MKEITLIVLTMTIGNNIILSAEEQKPSVTIATVQMERLASDLDYEKLRMYLMDKETLLVLRALSAEQAKLERGLLDVQDEGNMREIKNKIDFNNRKIQILKERSCGRDVNGQRIISDFIVKNFSSKYAIIVQGANGVDSKAIYENIKFIDISSEVSDAFTKDLDDKIGDK